jgi:hypothetical protein
LEPPQRVWDSSSDLEKSGAAATYFSAGDFLFRALKIFALSNSSY